MPSKDDKTCPSKIECEHDSTHLHVHVVCETCVEAIKKELEEWRDYACLSTCGKEHLKDCKSKYRYAK